MLLQQLSSGTIVALSMSELIGVIVSLLAIVGGIVAFARKYERDQARLDQNERDISRLSHEVTRLVEQVERLAVLASLKPAASRSAKKTTVK